MANVENINKLITVLSRTKSKGPIRMGGFIFEAPNKGSESVCGTVGCLAGWANTMRGFGEDGKFSKDIDDFSDTNAAAEWYGISPELANDLFYMVGPNVVSMSDFDRLPAETRVNITLELLRTLRDTGTASWVEAWKAVDPDSYKPLT